MKAENCTIAASAPMVAATARRLSLEPSSAGRGVPRAARPRCRRESPPQQHEPGAALAEPGEGPVGKAVQDVGLVELRRERCEGGVGSDEDDLRSRIAMHAEVC